jgi:hypothetical protein
LIPELKKLQEKRLVIYKESSIRLIADFPSEATEARRQ